VIATRKLSNFQLSVKNFRNRKETTIMNAQSNNLKSTLATLACLLTALAPTAAQAEGSILFNGANPAATATSKLENQSADILAGSNDITICVWVHAAGLGESSQGFIFCLDETGAALVLAHHSNPGELIWLAGFTGNNGSAKWTFPVTDGQWNAVALTYNKSESDNEPGVRVNFLNVTPQPAQVDPGTPRYSRPRLLCRKRVRGNEDLERKASASPSFQSHAIGG
jgi:hypothetical protein